LIPPNVYFEQIPVGSYKNFSYIVADKDSGEAAIFDPAWEITSLMSRLQSNKLRLQYIINTHAHMDHIQGDDEMKARTGAKVVMQASSMARKDLPMKDNDELRLGKHVTFKFIHTPGHSPESMCIVVNDFALMTGDTLFIGECGRVDLPGGDPNALFDTFERLRKLDPKLTVYPGHDYGPVPSSTLGEQLKTNYTLAPRTREEFVKFMMTP
jgi:hydroxyacylglutathione hydrolase